MSDINGVVSLLDRRYMLMDNGLMLRLYPLGATRIGQWRIKKMHIMSNGGFAGSTSFQP